MLTCLMFRCVPVTYTYFARSYACIVGLVYIAQARRQGGGGGGGVRGGSLEPPFWPKTPPNRTFY